MAEAGIFISQIGTSVPTAADYQFVFNSNWPSLACAYDRLVTIAPGGVISLPHNLGFYPFTLGWLIQNGVSMGRIFAPSENFQASPQTDVAITFNKKYVIVNNVVSSSYEVNVKCYNLDVSKAVNYTFPQYPGVNRPYDPTVGVKVVKYNKQITSLDLRDFIIHSRAQSPAVLSIVTGNSSDSAIVYNNPAKYTPWTFAFYTDSNGFYNGLAPGFQQNGALFQLGTNLSFTQGTQTVTANGAILASTVPNTNLSLVVLRDPLIVAGSVQVQY